MTGIKTHDEPSAELARAGAVVDKAIDYMVGQHIDGMVIASALLGGALEMLANGMDDASIVQVLESAIASVRAGDLRASAGGH